MAAAVTSRIKILARLNIAERRLPQDGRIQLKIQGRTVDFRVSTVPTMHGESVVMRILDRSAVALELEQLGFGPRVLNGIRDAIAKPHGIILVTGPTGSGKTTTLYAALREINTPERKILTVEDPVEYQLDGINQIQVNPKIELTFARALRSFLRQDPDVILVGEMRDRETANIAIQAALTGHLVLSTLHTNDAPSAITRLLDMGVEDYLITSTVNAIMAQRLVRTLCPKCKRPAKPAASVLEELRLPGEGDVKFWQSVGCDACLGTGYRGRTGIHELLVVNEDVRRLVMDHADAGVIVNEARAAGMVTMFEDGVEKAMAGLTSLEEVRRVTQM
jgi:general secretion pathway protein E